MNMVQWEADWKKTDRSQIAQGFMGQLKKTGLHPAKKWGAIEWCWPENDVIRAVFWKDFSVAVWRMA